MLNPKTTIGNAVNTIKYTSVLVLLKPCFFFIAEVIVPIKDTISDALNPMIAKINQTINPTAVPKLFPLDIISTSIIEDKTVTIAKITATIILYTLKFFIFYPLL